ncbi:MAG TPA: M6 family metalloprotease domain-containing protein [Spirochaetota bacterium]|nr:M6 family metalloprotease domain-containing protein [Spirochaetota bacterium]
MKKMIYVLLMLVPFIFSGARSDAMPPHPDLLKKWRDEGTLEKNMMKVQSVTVRRNMNVNKASSLSSGIIRIPVIIVSYSDTSASRTSGYFDNLLNGALPADMSVQKYYKDMSNNTLTVELDVYGPVTVSGTLGYYGANTGVAGTDAHPGELAWDAVTAATASIDFSQYDNNNDGYVDCVIIIHAGAGEESGAATNTIWSHQWDLYNAGVAGDGGGVITNDGKTISVYTMQAEYDISNNSTIGVFCHELGHVFGLPDLYDTNGTENGDTNGVGNWSLMASGSWGGNSDGKDPAPLLAWERYYAGGSSWVKYTDINPVSTIQHKDRGLPDYIIVIFITLLSISVIVTWKIKYLRNFTAPASAIILALAVSCTVEPATTSFDGSINDIESSHEAYRIPLAAQQYLILEGKTSAATTGWYVPGTGVLVTQIHEGIISTYYSSNTVNDGYDRVHGITVVEAKTSFEPGKLRDTDTNPINDNTYYGSADDLFCSENKSAISVSTTPGTDYYRNESVSSKTGDSGASITSISTRTTWPITFHAEY